MNALSEHGACCGLRLPGAWTTHSLWWADCRFSPGGPGKEEKEVQEVVHPCLLPVLASASESWSQQAPVLPASLSSLTDLLRPSCGLLDPSFELPWAAGLWKVPPVAGSSLLGSHLLRAAFPGHPGESFASPLSPQTLSPISSCHFFSFLKISFIGFFPERKGER